MIWYYFLYFLVTVFGAVLDSISFVVTSLPLGIDAFLTTGMGYFAYIALAFPPLGIIYGGFMWLLIAWKLPLFVLRTFRILK